MPLGWWPVLLWETDEGGKAQVEAHKQPHGRGKTKRMEAKGAFRVKRIALVLAMALILATVGGGVAAADPINSKKAETFTVTCDNGQTFTVVVAGGLPGHIVGSTRNIIPMEFTFTATDPDTGEVLFSETGTVGKGKKKGLQGDLISCTAGPFTEFVPELGQEVTFFIGVEAFLTPRGR